MTSRALVGQVVAPKQKSRPWVNAPTGPCWSCDAPDSPRYECDSQRHAWHCCAETCGQKVEKDGSVAWDDCHECQAEDVDPRDTRDPDADDAGESGERSYSGWMIRGGGR